jgi:hypothetical protein
MSATCRDDHPGPEAARLGRNRRRYQPGAVEWAGKVTQQNRGKGAAHRVREVSEGCVLHAADLRQRVIARLSLTGKIVVAILTRRGERRRAGSHDSYRTAAGGTVCSREWLRHPERRLRRWFCSEQRALKIPVKRFIESQ